MKRLGRLKLRGGRRVLSLLLGLALIGLSTFAPVQAERQVDNYDWTQNIFLESFAYEWEVIDIATDPSNNVYIVSHFDGPLSFGAGPFSTTGEDCSGAYCVLIMKVNTNGTLAWKRVITGAEYIEPAAIKTDNTGAVYIAGQFFDGTDFDPTAGDDYYFTLNGGNTSGDMFVTKLNTNGSYGWTRVYGGAAANALVTPADMVIDGNNNVYVTGQFSTTIDFDPYGASDEKIPSGSSDVFLTQVASDGTYGYTYQYGGASNTEMATALSVNSTNDVFIAGQFQNTVDFNPLAGTDNKSATGGIDAYITRINDDGTYGTTLTIKGAGTETIYGIDHDASDHLYYTGNFNGTPDFNPYAGTDSITGDHAGGTNLFMSRLNVDSTYGWTRIVKGPTAPVDLVVDSSQNIYAIGGFNDAKGAIDFDPGVGTDTQTAVSQTNQTYIWKMNDDGTYDTTFVIAGSTTDTVSGQAITVDQQDYLYYTGSYEGTVDFDPTANDDSQLSSDATKDIFITKLLPAFYQHIDGLTVGLSTVNLSNSESVDDENVDDGVPRGDTVTTRLLATDVPLADVSVDYTSDRDWSGVVGDSDPVTGRAFVHNLRNAPGVSADYTLYVPRLIGYDQVGFCPGADAYEELTDACAGYSIKVEADADTSIATIDGDEYWAITGVTGSGGFNVASESEPPPDDEEENPGGDSGGADEGTGAEGSAGSTESLAASGEPWLLLLFTATICITLSLSLYRYRPTKLR